MSYFKDQQKEWWEGGIFVYAEDNQIIVNLDDISDDPSEKELEKVYRRLYRKMKLPFGSIPGDYDPYNQCVT